MVSRPCATGKQASLRFSPAVLVSAASKGADAGGRLVEAPPQLAVAPLPDPHLEPLTQPRDRCLVKAEAAEHLTRAVAVLT